MAKTNIKRVGRPIKKNAIKAGQLRPGLTKLTFAIAKKKKVKLLALLAPKQSIKDLMNGIVDAAIRQHKPKKKNEQLLRTYIANNKPKAQY